MLHFTFHRGSTTSGDCTRTRVCPNDYTPYFYNLRSRYSNRTVTCRQFPNLTFAPRKTCHHAAYRTRQQPRASQLSCHSVTSITNTSIYCKRFFSFFSTFSRFYCIFFHTILKQARQLHADRPWYHFPSCYPRIPTRFMPRAPGTSFGRVCQIYVFLEIRNHGFCIHRFKSLRIFFPAKLALDDIRQVLRRIFLNGQSAFVILFRFLRV